MIIRLGTRDSDHYASRIRRRDDEPRAWSLADAIGMMRQESKKKRTTGLHSAGDAREKGIINGVPYHDRKYLDHVEHCVGRLLELGAYSLRRPGLEGFSGDRLLASEADKLLEANAT